MQSDVPNSESASESVSTVRRRARRYRIAAVVILVLGGLGAGLLYWARSGGADFSGDPSMLRFNRAEQHQLGVLYGKQGRLVADLSDSLKQPGTQAILILIGAAVLAVGCVYVARILEDEAARPRGD